jgi:hypothetical protein
MLADGHGSDRDSGLTYAPVWEEDCGTLGEVCACKVGEGGVEFSGEPDADGEVEEVLDGTLFVLRARGK